MSLVNRGSYMCTLTIIITSTSSKCSSIKFQVLLNNLHIFTASKVYEHTMSKMTHSPSLPKVPHHFPQSTNYQNFHFVWSKPQWLQTLVLFCKRKKTAFHSVTMLCNHVFFNLTYLGDVVLVTFTGHIETLSIICTTSTVICDQREV